MYHQSLQQLLSHKNQNSQNYNKTNPNQTQTKPKPNQIQSKPRSHPSPTKLHPNNHNITHQSPIMVYKETEFPFKLIEMLNDAEILNFTHIVSWLPDQKSFRVHDTKEFAASIMSRYFTNQTKYKSFLRQLNM